MFSGISRTIAFVTGLFCSYLALAMIPPMVVDLLDGNEDWQGFLIASFVTGAVSITLLLANRDTIRPFTPQMGFLLVNVLWLASSLVCALPFMLGGRTMSFTDAAFEAVSGLTTTGATVLVGLDDAPRGLLLWRSLTQWVGGIGIVAMGLLILPMLRIGGMQFFRMESSERSDKPVERLATFALYLVTIYTALTLTCAILYAFGGMSIFDAVNHAMTTIATGGFATHDSSMAQYGNAVLLTAIVFMLIGAMPFAVMYIAIVNHGPGRAFDVQVRAMLLIALVLTVPTFLSAHSSQTLSPVDSFIHSSFNVVSIMTTTGYVSTDYTEWGDLAVGVFLVVMALGGCAGSTSGGFKIYRLVILARTLRVALRELVYPHGVFPVRYNGQRVSPETLRAIALFLFAFVALLLLGTVMLAATGLDLTTALSGALSAIANVGPGLGDVIGPVGNFSSFTDTAKWVMIVLMIAGRLEIMTLIVVLTPDFWRSH